jgi:threonylcarbamoyladenosine tRNA methylthiotransferase CDKAL1
MPNINIKSYGCSANTADAEIARGALKQKGYRFVNNPYQADLNIVFTCVVKSPTEKKVSKELRELEASGKPLIVAGCMPKSMPRQTQRLVPTASLVGPDDIERITEAAERTLKKERVVFIDGNPTDRTCLPRVRENSLVHIAPISSGCLGNCSYCIVKLARGNLYSFPVDNIVKDIRNAINENCLEIWVTAEDTAAYNYGGIRLPELLDRIANIEGNFRVRVGMTTPNQLEPVLEKMINSLSSPKIYKFIHIPIQSGNDEILQKMRRKYSVQDFKQVVTKFRETIPEIGISTDIICGFPGESGNQFQESLNLISWLKPDVLNINRFWERPGTDASKMPGRLHGRDTKERSRIMTNLWKEIAVNVGQKWIDWEGDILLTEYGKKGTKVGRNYTYKTIAVKTEASLGSFIKVKVEKSGVGYLTGIEI